MQEVATQPNPTHTNQSIKTRVFGFQYGPGYPGFRVPGLHSLVSAVVLSVL